LLLSAISSISCNFLKYFLYPFGMQIPHYGLSQFLAGPGQLQCERSSIPAGAEKILTVAACGVCRTDRKAFLKPPGGMELPRVLGHEIAGHLTIDLVQANCMAGDRVVLWPALSCGICQYCSSGHENLCPDIRLFGYHLHGGFAADLYCAGEDLERLQFFPIPRAMSWETAVFSEPLACVVNGLNKVNKVPQSVFILGCGVMGRLAARLAKARWQAAVFYHDIDPVRLDFAAGDGEPFRSDLLAELVFVAASSSQALAMGLEHLAPGGTMVLFSGMDRGTELSCLHNDLHRKEQCLVGAYGCTPHDFAYALNMLADKRVVVDDLISRRIALAELPGELAHSPEATEFKTVVKS
jgi:L-iditol 2-dehydrogenase